MRFALYVALISALAAAPALAADVEPEFEVSGKVLLPDGSPAAGAVVDTWYPRHTPRATANASGAFIMDLKPGEYYFRASAGTFAGREREAVRVKMDGTLSKPIELRLEKGCMVTGKLIDKTTGKPIAGAKILTRDYDAAVTQEDGTFAFPALPKGNYEATVFREGYHRPMFGFTTVDRDTLDLPLETKPEGVIKGRVTNEKGEPVKGASVGPSGTSFDFERTRTDENGCFVLTGFDPDGRVEEVYASADGYESQMREGVAFPSGQRELTLDFVLLSKSTEVRNVTGRVTKADGAPIEGAKVSYGFSNCYVGYKDARTGKDGAYQLKDLDQQQNLVVVQCKGYAPAFGFAAEKVDVKLDFKLQRGHRAAGRIVDEKGKPIEGVEIAAMAQTAEMDKMGYCGRELYRYLDPHASTGKDGRFELADLPADGVLVDIYTAKSFTDQRNMPLKVDKLDHVIVLQPRGEIRGKVVAAKDGKPVTQFTVLFDFPTSGKCSGLSPGLTEHGVTFNVPDGVFTMGGEDTGESRRVIVEAPGFCREAVGSVLIVPKGKADPSKLVFKLKPAVRFEGTVTQAGTGEPLEGVMVNALDTSQYGMSGFEWGRIPRQWRPVSARTDAQGRFSIECAVSSGSVMLEKPGWGRVAVPTVSFARPFTAAMDRAASISGVMADASAKPASGVRTSVRSGDGAFKYGEVTTGPDGRFQFADLPPGECQVEASDNRRVSKVCSIELRAGEDCVVDWNAPSACAIEGVVTMKGKPVSDAHLLAYPEGKPMYCAIGDTGPDGSYRLPIRKPGAYRVAASRGEWGRPDHVYVRRLVYVRPGASRLDVVLPGASLSGVLRDSMTKKPLANADVTAYRRAWEQDKYGAVINWSAQHAGAVWWSEKSAKADKSGRFQFTNMEPGEWILAASLAGGKGSAQGRPFRLGRDEQKRGIVLEPSKTGSAEVAVIDARTGKPIRDAFAVCVNREGMASYPERDKTCDEGG